MVDVHFEALDGAAGGETLRIGHADHVALVDAGMADRHGARPTSDAVVRRVALIRGEHLGVAHLVDALVRVGYHRRDRDRPGP